MKQADSALLSKYSASSFDEAGEAHHGEGLQRGNLNPTLTSCKLFPACGE